MAIQKHPITGVELNVLSKKRKFLDDVEAVTVFLLRFEGVDTTEITHKMGTNPARVAEVLNGEVHPKARTQALRLIQERKLSLL
ncbi:hypothetical protein [Seohaeicola zhoushanensis]|uniref:Uncharacterized protein n=1 Tax=Seohaeicola zhoushanensis TaxID=1569283 RepID=A0A8J3H333_9RHOB|nr:hypothetical protein [Seohaeicola zhoushanensis]GHF71027.1 hypothetical protein GCM10017056_47430 [Seohaeicola zhoushanensis]